MWLQMPSYSSAEHGIGSCSSNTAGQRDLMKAATVRYEAAHSSGDTPSLRSVPIGDRASDWNVARAKSSSTVATSKIAVIASATRSSRGAQTSTREATDRTFERTRSMSSLLDIPLQEFTITEGHCEASDFFRICKLALQDVHDSPEAFGVQVGKRSQSIPVSFAHSVANRIS